MDISKIYYTSGSVKKLKSNIIYKNRIFKVGLLCLTIMFVVFVVNFIAKVISPTSERIEKIDSSTPIIKITAKPSTNIPLSFESADFNGLLAFIGNIDTEYNWVLDRGDTEVMYIYSAQGDQLIMERMGATFFRGSQDYCSIVGSVTCAKSDLSKNHILIPANTKRFQPYSVLPVLVHELRHIYQFEANTRESCFDDEIDAYTWESKFWGSLNRSQKQHIDGYDDSETREENKRLELYNNGQLSNYVHEQYKGICK